MSYSLGPDQAWSLVGSDLGPNCLQRLSANCTSRQGFLGIKETDICDKLPQTLARPQG